jgi:large subunit ribosomal protein L23
MADQPQTEAVAAPEPVSRLEAYQVILRPLITEKNVHKAERLTQYSFEINPKATKEDVRRAVESLFDV